MCMCNVFVHGGVKAEDLVCLWLGADLPVSDWLPSDGWQKPMSAQPGQFKTQFLRKPPPFICVLAYFLLLCSPLKGLFAAALV